MPHLSKHLKNIRICFVGDIYLGSAPEKFQLSRDISDIFAEADLVIGNLEGPITMQTNPALKKTCIRSEVDAIDMLKLWGIDAVSLANNHIFDYGWDAFCETTRLLDKVGIRYFGAGANIQEARRPLSWNFNGIKIAIVGCASSFIQTTIASEKCFGCAPLDDELIINQILSLKRFHDIVIVLPHWGYCDYIMPNPGQIKIAHTMFSAGATAIVGMHTHVAQGFSSKHGKGVAYSLGNFVFAPFDYGGQPAILNTENMKGLLLDISIANQIIRSFRVIPTINDAGLVRFDLTDQRIKEQVDRDRMLNDHHYNRLWRSYNIRRLIKRIIYWINVRNFKRINIDTFRGGVLMLKNLFKSPN